MPVDVGEQGMDRFVREINLDEHYIPYPMQAQFHRSAVPHRLLGGAAGPGKTLALIIDHMLAANEFEDPNQAKQVHTLLLRRTHPKLEATLITRFREKIPQELYKDFNESKKEVTWHNGATTNFGSMQYEHDAYGHQGQWFKIGYDELAEFTFKQWQATSAWNRCPVSPYCTKDGASNPIGVGASWIKDLFVDHKPADEMDAAQRQNYNPEDYEYFPCTFRDNPIYANDPVFLANLQQYTAGEREALMNGVWGMVAGYFSGAWDPAVNVYESSSYDLKPWHKRWISGDWGFEHWATTYWHAIDDFGVIRTYRELVVNHQPPEALAELILKHSYDADGQLPRYDGFYYSHDAFHQKTDANTIALRMGRVLAAGGLPSPTNAGTDKVGREQLMYQLLVKRHKLGEAWDDEAGKSVPIEEASWQIADCCPRLIKAIPAATRDELKPEQIAQFPGLDMVDGAGHGLYGKLGRPSQKPRSVVLQEALEKIPDNTQKHLTAMRMKSDWAKKSGPIVKGGDWRRKMEGK